MECWFFGYSFLNRCCINVEYSINTCGSVDFWDQTKLTYRPLKPELSATCALAWKRQQPFGIAAEKFIEHVCKALQK